MTRIRLLTLTRVIRILFPLTPPSLTRHLLYKQRRIFKKLSLCSEREYPEGGREFLLFYSTIIFSPFTI